MDALHDSEYVRLARRDPIDMNLQMISCVQQPVGFRCDYWRYVRRLSYTSHLDAQRCRPRPVWREAGVNVTLIEIDMQCSIELLMPALAMLLTRSK